MALQLMVENAMPPTNNELHDSNDANHPLGNYDEDQRTPVESEFLSLTSTFRSYSEQDIQSLTTASTRYLHYQEDDSQPRKPKRPRRRSKEEGIRYRTLYSGVQAASLEPKILRAFTILFEDYAPIRLAGRRIYKHLNTVMEEVREERMGEITRAREICPNWDRRVDGGENVIEYARNFWDTLMDEALLLDHSLEPVAKDEESQEGGVISLYQLIHLGIDKVLIQDGLVNNTAELECIVRQIALEDVVEFEKHYNQKKEHDLQEVQDDGKYLEMTFAIFMKMLYQCTSLQKQSQNVSHVLIMLQEMEKVALDHRIGDLQDQDTSTLLAAKAVLSGSNSKCKKRQKYSNRFDEYVSKFNLWEQKFLRNSNAEMEEQQSRRFEILLGCFVGARNEKNVAALKIVYMDYTALRLGGDLIFQLMSKIANNY